ncbi:MAG: TIGR00730 family Rossman fold protein [Bacteroidaceae bacterium]|nr:TIGR00730 family Rossman fold protein [Bacteroidaceae bacterium]
MKKIAVFCSAIDDIDAAYIQAANDLGQWIGKNQHTLVYGGSSMGLMEHLAKAVKEQNGNVIGVVPSKLEENNKVSLYIDQLITTHNLSDRKDVMVQQADAIVALPGGIGTLDEVFHVMAASSIGYHEKRVIFYNVNGFFQPLLTWINQLHATGFMRHPVSHYFDLANTLDELLILLNN